MSTEVLTDMEGVWGNIWNIQDFPKLSIKFVAENWLFLIFVRMESEQYQPVKGKRLLGMSYNTGNTVPQMVVVTAGTVV